MASTTIDKLPELIDPEYTDKINILVLRNIYNSDIAYKTDLINLSTFYFPTIVVRELIDSLDNLKNEIDNKVKELENSNYMNSQNYVTKNYANKFRSQVMTEERLNRVLDDFITYDKLSVYMEESELHANQLASEIINYMANAASTAKFGAANQLALEEVTDAITSIEIPDPNG